MNYSNWVFKGGCHLFDRKTPASQQPLIKAVVPDKIYISTVQHAGAPAKPLVKKGDEVKRGQLICEAQGFISANIHSSVSGKVIGIEKNPIADGRFVDCIILENDGLDTLDTSISSGGDFDEEILPSEIIEKIKTCGVVGLGGAAFPTHIKYLPNKDDKKVEHIILNGIECEPYISNDYKVMMEMPEKIIHGLRYMMKAADCNKAYIAIEDNKIDAYKKIVEMTRNLKMIEPVLCKEKYPQGSEKQLVYSVTGKEIPAGKLPIDVGVIVNNVSTAWAVAEAVENNMPITERVVTVNGSGVDRVGNYIVRIGTLYRDLFKDAGGIREKTIKVINGGPMMGFSVPHLDLPVLKHTTAILFLSENDIPNFTDEKHCVRCARCIDACPMHLSPTTLMHAVKRKDIEGLEDGDLLSCVECGSCTYVCPANIPLVQYFRLGKQYLRNNGQGIKNPDFII